MPFIASGTYGCTFSPPVICSNKKERKPSPKEVGKIFADDKEAQLEYELQKKIVQKIDPKGIFTIPLYDICEVSRFQPDDKASHCPHVIDKNSPIKQNHYQQLIYAHGGISLEMLMKTEKGSFPKFKKLLVGFENIISGISLLNSKGFVHQDIKPANILVKKRGNDYDIHLIDFGLLTSTDIVYSEYNAYVLNHPYPFYPPEFKLGLAKDALSTFKRYVTGNFLSSSLISPKKRLIELGVDFDKSVEATFKHQRRDPMKIDTYSIGIVLIMLYDWAYKSIRNHPEFIVAFGKLIQDMCSQDSMKRKNSKVVAKLFKAFIQDNCADV